MTISTPSEIVNGMYNSDLFSQWLGIEILEISKGKSVLEMTIRKEMVNGLGIAHGGITYSLSDTALAFASNSHGKKSVSVETSISHTAPCKIGDKLIATAKEESLSNKIGIYSIKVVNQNNDTVALFKGTVYRTNKEWEV